MKKVEPANFNDVMQGRRITTETGHFDRKASFQLLVYPLRGSGLTKTVICFWKSIFMSFNWYLCENKTSLEVKFP